MVDGWRERGSSRDFDVFLSGTFGWKSQSRGVRFPIGLGKKAVFGLSLSIIRVDRVIGLLVTEELADSFFVRERWIW